MTVRVANKTMEQLQDEKTFMVVVTAGNVRVTLQEIRRRSWKHGFHSAGEEDPVAATTSRGLGIPPPTQPFEIKLPSGKVLTSMTVDVRDTVSREIDTLAEQVPRQQSRRHRLLSGWIGFYGRRSGERKGNKLQGPTVIFHRAHDTKARSQNNTSTYHNGRWDGVLATWNVQGQKEFWGNYASGQRQGLCCLFNDDALAAVLECTRNKIDAVHLIAANQVRRVSRTRTKRWRTRRPVPCSSRSRRSKKT